MAAAANVLIKIGANAGQAIGEISKVNGALGKQMTASQKAGSAVKKAAVPATIALVALAGAAISSMKAAAEDEQAQVKLAGTLKRVAGATDDAVKATEDHITQLSLATGVSDDQLRPAMAKLATATGSVTKAQGALSVALDISAATGKSVDAVSLALSKAYAGNGAALTKLIPGIDEAAIKSGDFAKINAELARVTGGAAAESANTAAGQFQRFQIAIAETKEGIGAALLPLLNTITPVLLKLATAAQANTDVFVKVGIAIAAVAGTIVAVNAAMKLMIAVQAIIRAATIAWTVAQWLLNVALTANPIGLVVVAIAALIGGLILAYRNSETFRNIVDNLMTTIIRFSSAALKPFIENWGSISAAIGFVIEKAKILWPFLLPGGALYLGVTTINEKFGILRATIDTVRGVFETIRTTIGRVGDKINEVIEAVRRLVDWLGRIRVPTINIPGIGRSSVDGKGLAESGATIVNVTINGPIDSDSTAREILGVLERYDRRRGVFVA